jgi:SAM-dependent methyltransferase
VHAEAHAWVAEHAPADALRVLDLGGRDINGTTRGLFPAAGVYQVVDILPGPGVDVVADAATWTPDGAYDVVVSTETFEHTAVWPDICQTVFKALRPGGLFIATMAGPGRPAPSAIDGGWSLHPGEHYQNVDPADLARVLGDCGFVEVVTDRRDRPADTRCTARRPA